MTSTGSRPALFFVAPGDGNPVSFAPLARRLGSDQPFYALQPIGGDRRRLPHRSVEAMAAFHLRHVLRVQPDGPYLLGGRCLGSLVAFEMARLLAARGAAVALLLVLDSGGPLWRPRPLADGTLYDDMMNGAVRRSFAHQPVADVFTDAGTEWLLGWLREPALVARDGTVINRYLDHLYRMRTDVRDAFPNLAEHDAARFVDWVWLSGRYDHALADSLLPTPASPDARRPRQPPGFRERLSSRASATGSRVREAIDQAADAWRSGSAGRLRARTLKASLHASATYRAGPYDGTVTLVRSEEYVVHSFLDRWHAVAGSVREVGVRGTHRSMLREPDVAALADCVRGLVDEVTSGEERPAAARTVPRG